LQTPWDELQLAYFAGYAMWTYLTTPFLFALPGVLSEEIESWKENGNTWRRLEVNFPDTIATHSGRQTFYFDESGLIQRHDYDVDIAGGSPAAHYVYDHQVVEGLVVPMKHRVFIRQPNNKPLAEPLVVSVDLDNIRFSQVNHFLHPPAYVALTAVIFRERSKGYEKQGFASITIETPFKWRLSLIRS
jgi:hypothetical protein